MTNAEEAFEDQYSEYDEFDDDEDDDGLSGFSVLAIGIVMLFAFVAITWIAYHQGIKRGEAAGGTPYVAADPEPIKIETADATEPEPDREVYDVFDGENTDTVTVLADGPEEPIDRNSQDTIASLAAEAEEVLAEAGEEAASAGDRIADLAAQDANAFNNDAGLEVPEPTPAPVETTRPTATDNLPPAPEPVVAPAGGALSGSHVVQVGAFRSDAEARAQWARLQSRLGNYVDGKSIHVEEADLGDRGVYHRLRIGPFSSSGDASTYCSGLKERGQDCLIKSI